MRSATLVFFLLAACKGSSQGPSWDSIVVHNPNWQPRGRPMEKPEWFDEQIQLVREEADQGRLYDALVRISKALKRRPADAHAQELRRLGGEINTKVLALPTLEVELEPKADPIVFGEVIGLKLRLRNVSGRPLIIPARRRRTSHSTLVLDVRRTGYDINAHVVIDRYRILRRLEKDIEIEPNDWYELDLELPEARNDRPLEGFRFFHIEGRLRPVYVDIGGLRRWESIPLGSARVRAFRPNFEHLRDDPLARMEQAMAKNARVHLLTACALVAPADRRRAVDLLVGRLQGAGALDRTIFGCLEYLTEVNLGRDALAWRTWWARVRETYFTAPPERPDPAVPTFGN
ncbi:MAG: hypothetical protein ACE10D_07295 [Planctomycetota bacterium]|nr:hypothetical protein [Planctomycetota bacterium]